MKLTYTYLVVLTVLCGLTIVLPIPGLVLNQWLRFKMTTVKNESVIKQTVDYGFGNVNVCVNLFNTDSRVCSTTTIKDVIKIHEMMLTKVQNSKEVIELHKWIEFQYKIKKDLTSSQILVILGIVIELCGLFLAMSFWRRTWNRWASCRKYLSACSWLAASILLLTATIIAIHLNKSFEQVLHDYVSTTDKLALMKGVKEESTFKVMKAWCLLYIGLGSLHAMLTSIFVLLATCFRIREPKYTQLSTNENIDLQNRNKESRQPLLGVEEDEQAENNPTLYI